MVQRAALSSVQSGIAGEYFVAAELSRRGYVASLTLRNTRGIDILASNRDATRSVGIQVKATQGNYDTWLVHRLARDELASNLFFVFVSMNALAAPKYHIVPRKIVLTYTEKRHKLWLKGTKRDGSERKDTNMRQFADPSGKYRDRWDLLKLG
jgi:hypothetical protein